jgi:Flp pilus assembly protein TadD
LLLVGGVVYWNAALPDSEQVAYALARQRLMDGDFEGVRGVLATASDEVRGSARLRNLEAQAVRQVRAEITLASAGRLSDFGYDLGGVTARSASSPESSAQLQEAERILAAAGDPSVEVSLNRGEILLRRGEYSRASAVFDDVIAAGAGEPLAWLGKGLAAFFQDDFVAAEQAFRRCRELDPSNVAAAINLAMTLEEQNEVAAARQLWMDVLKLELSPSDRSRIEAHLGQRE